MKTKLCLTILLSFSFYLLSSQVPRGFNYQAIVRDGTTKQPIISQPILVRITIENIAEAAVYQETHSLSTDEFGIISIVVGEGIPIGSDLFEDIDWNEEQLYIKTELKYPTTNPTFTEMGTAPLLSVPYAMVADFLSVPITKLLVEGESTSYEEPLFEVRNYDGNTVFAVYNEGVRIYVGDGALKGPKGGFAIGGFGSVKDENNKRYLFVDDDSVRIYINDAAKSAKGGFAIGGYGTTKGGGARYLKVTSDSTRIVTTDSEQGFAVGSGSTGSYLRLTPENYFIGHGAGKSIVNGKYNSFIGYEAGKKTQSGAENIFVGYQSGLNNIEGKWNTFLGYKAGMTNTGNDNTFIGYMAGSAHQSLGGNVYIGSKAGQNATNGQQNVLIGESVGANISTGSYNVMLGFEAGISNEEGLRNVFLGYQAGWSNTLGRYNVFIGDGAGYSNIGTTGFPGNYNVFLGYLAGYYNKTGQDNVFLGKQSGWKNDSGIGNIYIGMNAGANLTVASSNVFIGSQAGSQKTGGGNNILIGVNAGYQNAAGSGNIFIGSDAGKTEEGSSLLYIENSDSSSPLIGGDFTAHKVAIYGKPDPLGATLQVNGSIRIGLSGSTIWSVIKATGGATLTTPLVAGASSTHTVSVANVTTAATVMISPTTALPSGLVISYARVSTNGTVEVMFTNASADPIIGCSVSFNITVIQ